MGKIRPKYLSICHDIRSKIQDGTYPVHEYLPDGTSLAKTYGVSLMTLKRALDLLVAEGYIIRRRGDGTLVRDWKVEQLPHLYSLKGTYYDYQNKVASRILKFEVTHPSSAVAEKLSLTEDDFVYEIIRLRILEGRPIIIEYTFMPITVIPGLKRQHLERSIYEYITKELKRKVHSAFVKVSGVRPTKLEQVEMNLAETDFLMEIEQVGSLDNCRVFEYSISHHLPDVFDFETVMFNQ
ncbi:GntR family transcriptional regulator [Streptococcus orisasini]|uniref:GntR family transcriptional regulator n=1 Tax=Streptococcus orisasini TaxID=1080071 RepID=UPI00070B0D5E|nr:GntR family transcriptional regulator [Streptococcus orisasini]